MHFDFSDEQRAIREAANGLLQQRSPVGRIAEAVEAGADDEALWQEMTELGWAGIALPEELDGQGLAMVELCLLLEEQGATLSRTPLLPSACAGRLLLHGGDDAQRQRWLPKLAAGQTRGGFGRLGDGNALVAGAAGADLVTLASERTGLLLEVGQEPLEASETIDPLRSYGHTAPCGQILGCDVPRGIQEAAICGAAELLGVARFCLETTVEYVKDRRQFGVPVGSFQAIGHKCAEMLYRVEGARAAVYYGAWAADAAPEQLPRPPQSPSTLPLRARSRSLARRSRPTAESASPGKRTSTIGSSALRSTRSFSAARPTTALGSAS